MSVRRRIRLLGPVSGALLAAVLAAAGCSSSASDSGSGSNSHTSNGSSKNGSSAAGFPAKAKGAEGTVTVPKKPQRIVSLSPSDTETLYAIGAGKQVKAVDSLSDRPKDAPRTKLSAFKPDAEAVAAYHPDLIVADASAPGKDSLAKLGVPVLRLAAPATLDQMYDQMRQLGTATGHRAEADKTANSVKAQLAKIAKDTPKPKQPLTYFHELDPTYHTATSTTFVGQIYNLFGLRNVADAGGAGRSGGYPQLSSEALLKSDPDLYFLADGPGGGGQSPAALKKRPGFADAQAVKKNDITVLNVDDASRWGPHITAFAQQVADAVRRAEGQ